MAKIIQLKKQLVDSKLPTKIELYQELLIRGALSTEQAQELEQLQFGQEGEQTLIDYFRMYGESHWSVFQNVWVDYYGKFEVDCLLITSNQIYLFEVKNYKGQYVYENSQCRCNGQKIGHNAISQTQKSYINFTNFLRQNKINVPVTGVLLFTGIDCEVTIHDEIGDLKVVRRNQLRNFIHKIKHDERNYRKDRVDIDSLRQVLDDFEIHNPFLPDAIPSEIVSRIRNGVRCSHCHSFEVDALKMYVCCLCGIYEPIENAIIRTICEFALIHFDSDLLINDLVIFFNGDYSRGTIKKYMDKHFTQISFGRNMKYANNIRFNNVKFKLPRYFKC